MAINMALAATRTGTRVGFVSAEQPGSQIAQRMLSLLSGIPAVRLRNPREMQESDWPMLTKAVSDLGKQKIEIFDASAPCIGTITDWALNTPGLEILFVDYLQRIPGMNRRASRYDQISEVAMGLKNLARELNIPVVALAQINRAGVEKGGMEHIKGSGDIEQEADIVMILERDAHEMPDVAQLVLDKNRHGPLAYVPLEFHVLIMRFIEQQKQGAVSPVQVAKQPFKLKLPFQIV